jgi:hypothetical protein
MKTTNTSHNNNYNNNITVVVGSDEKWKQILVRNQEVKRLRSGRRRG